MLSLSDFSSWPALTQAALVGAGSVMAWRGLHLSGDRGRYKLLWGFLCVGSFIGALLVGALANHDSAQSLADARRDRQAALDSLGGIQATLNTMNVAMTKIANAANVDPNQSAQSLADQIIGRLSAMDKQITQTESRVSTLENPPHDPNSLYQGKMAVAKFVQGKLSEDHRQFEFLEIYNASGIDFSQPIEFRDWVMKCQPHPVNVGISFEPGLGAISNIMNGVMCSVVSGG